MTVFAWVIAAVVLVIAVLAAVATRVPILEGPARRAVMSAEALLVLVVVVDLGTVLGAGRADRPESMITHVGYAVATVGIVPLVVFRRPAAADADRTAETGDGPEQASLLVVVVALVAAAICVVRLVQTR